MRSVGTLRACSRCLQGQAGVHPGLTSNFRNARLPLDNIQRDPAYTSHGQYRKYRCSPPSQAGQSTSIHSSPLQSTAPSYVDSAETGIHALIASSHDSSSLIALLPEVETHVWQIPVQETIEVFAAVLRKMGDLNALSLLPEILRLFRLIVEEASRFDGELWSAEALNAAYLPVILALGTFWRQDSFNSQSGQRQTQKLHPIIHDHVLNLVQDLIDRLSRLPGPSNRHTPLRHRSVISKEILELLFDPRYLNPDHMGFYLQYCTANNIQRGSLIWWRCSVVALENGDKGVARRFERQAAKIAKEERKARKAGLPDDVATIGVGLEDRPTGAGEERMNKLGEEIAILMRTRHSKNLRDVVPTLEGRLEGPPDETTNHAWSHLLNAARRDKSVDSDLLRSLHDSISESALSGHTMTAVMLGFVRAGDLSRAWEVWLDLVERQPSAAPEEKGRYVDRVALSAAIYVCHALHGLDAAVTLVDSWARRVRSTPSPVSSANSITLDTRIINILLHLCKIDNRPSIAFRLFAAARPRWGVHTDAISLSLLLDTARYTNDNQEDRLPDIGSRLRQMAGQLRLRHATRRAGDTQSYDAYDASGFSKGSVSVLLDQEGYTWADDNDEPPWLRAKNQFEMILFTNWPWLSTIVSPIDYTHGPYAHKLRDFSSLFLTRQESIKDDIPTSLRLPTNTSYTHLTPSAGAFHSYIALLGYYHLPEEIPKALAWMKALNIKPRKQTMVTALMYIEDVEGPRRLFSDWDKGASRLLSDGDVLKRWLKDWLQRGIPTEDEVAVYVREYMRRHKGLSA